ncbi:MAG: flavin reductase [Ruminococcus sp.]|nr:flavin reductase [Ruminococcus sp.]
MSAFREIPVKDITDNPFKLIGEDWGLVAVKNNDGCNMMTVAWGGVGIMWRKPAAFTFIRPQRFSFPLLENEEYFTICFFDESQREALRLCGTKSGRDTDKVKETGLTPVYDEKAPYFKEARLVLVCKKMYAQFLNEESVIDGETVLKNYDNDYHKMYISEIVKVLENEA